MKERKSSLEPSFEKDTRGKSPEVTSQQRSINKTYISMRGIYFLFLKRLHPESDLLTPMAPPFLQWTWSRYARYSDTR